MSENSPEPLVVSIDTVEIVMQTAFEAGRSRSVESLSLPVVELMVNSVEPPDRYIPPPERVAVAVLCVLAWVLGRKPASEDLAEALPPGLDLGGLVAELVDATRPPLSVGSRPDFNGAYAAAAGSLLQGPIGDLAAGLGSSFLAEIGLAGKIEIGAET